MASSIAGYFLESSGSGRHSRLSRSNSSSQLTSVASHFSIDAASPSVLSNCCVLEFVLLGGDFGVDAGDLGAEIVRTFPEQEAEEEQQRAAAAAAASPCCRVNLRSVDAATDVEEIDHRRTAIRFAQGHSHHGREPGEAFGRQSGAWRVRTARWPRRRTHRRDNPRSPARLAAPPASAAMPQRITRLT